MLTYQTSPADVLLAARDLIADESRWTRFAEARDAEGVPVLATAKGAARFCMVGAVMHVTRVEQLDFEAYDQCWPHLMQACGGTVSAFNDSARHSHADVLAAMDRAIVLAKEAE